MDLCGAHFAEAQRDFVSFAEQPGAAGFGGELLERDVLAEQRDGLVGGEGGDEQRGVKLRHFLADASGISARNDRESVGGDWRFEIVDCRLILRAGMVRMAEEQEQSDEGSGGRHGARTRVAEHRGQPGRLPYSARPEFPGQPAEQRQYQRRGRQDERDVQNAACDQEAADRSDGQRQANCHPKAAPLCTAPLPPDHQQAAQEGRELKGGAPHAEPFIFHDGHFHRKRFIAHIQHFGECESVTGARDRETKRANAGGHRSGCGHLGLSSVNQG